MLIELHCDKFRKTPVKFYQGLNVVLGDEKATNSIGKSNLLMVLDFVFGGTDFINKNTDVIEELGHHYYLYTFLFDQKYYFKRGTNTPDLVYICDAKYNEKKPIDVSEYTRFLAEKYNLKNKDISFRSYVGLFCRIWPKDNIDPKKPLHYFPSQKPEQAIDNMLKRYALFENIRALSEDLKVKTGENSVLNKAEKNNITKKILKKEYTRNEIIIQESNQELRDIEEHLSKYVSNISEIINRESLELKEKKDSLLSVRTSLQSKLRRIQRNLSENRYFKSKNLIKIEEIFPTVNSNRILEIDNFHSKISKILRKEIQEKEKFLISSIAEVNKEISIIDKEINSLTSNIKKPELIIGRVKKLSLLVSNSTRQNEYYDARKKLRFEIKTTKEKLLNEREKSTNLMGNIINDKARNLVNHVYSEDRKSPELKFSPKNYSFITYEDTGTGKAYSNLLILDISIFKTANIPFLIHDSLLFKNIENNAVSNLINEYNSIKKQSFISIDEIDKYGTETAKLLRSKSRISLSDSRVLYIKDWRK